MTTSRKRHLPWGTILRIAVLFLSQILFQKLSRKRPLLKFLNDRDQQPMSRPRPTFYWSVIWHILLFSVSHKRLCGMIRRMIVKKPLHECHKSSVFDSAEQACWQIIFDLQKKTAVIRSVGKKVARNIDVRCDQESFNSFKHYSMHKIVASCLFAYVFASFKLVM